MAQIATKLCQIAFQTIPDVLFFDAEKKIAKSSDLNFRFSLIWHGFGRATAERTSKSASSSNFALDRLTQRSVRPKTSDSKFFGPNKSFFPRMPCRIPNTFSVRDLFPRPHIRESNLCGDFGFICSSAA